MCHHVNTMAMRGVSLAILVLLNVSLGASGQGNAPPPAGTVRLWITALEKGHPVTDLTKEDFELRIGRQEQPISALTFNPPVPLSVGLLIDVSGSRRLGWPAPELGLASAFFRQSVRPGDQDFVVDFTTTPYLDAGPTDSLPALDQGLQRVAQIQPDGPTAIYDAIYSACELPEPGQNLHRTLVVISDGDDNSSRFTVHQALDMARTKGTLLYMIGTPEGPYPSHRGAAAMSEAARMTGGMFFRVSRRSDTEKAFDSIAKTLHAQYALDFPPIVAPGEKKMEIRIKCKRPHVRIVAPEKY